MHRFLLAVLILAAGVGGSRADTIGQASSVVNDVTGEVSSVVAKILPGIAVSANELVRTGTASSTLLKFLDSSNLNVGANSAIRLDKFVFNPDQSSQSGIINLAVGAMRYVSASTEPKGFAIETPVATISIRGTDIVLICSTEVKCVVLVGAGKIRVCPWPPIVHPVDNCPDAYDLDDDRNFTLVGPNGQNSGPLRINDSMIAAIIALIAGGGTVPPPAVLALEASLFVPPTFVDPSAATPN